MKRMMYYKPTKILGAILLLPATIFVIAVIVSTYSQAGKLAIVGAIIVGYIVVVGIITSIDHEANKRTYAQHRRQVEEIKRRQLPPATSSPDRPQVP